MTSRILLIEDEPGLVVTLTDLLRSEGYEVSAESNGETGLQRALTEAFDVIVLDVMLPKKDGYQVCRELRERGVDAAILMLTAKTQVMDRVAGLRLGADDYLAKPFDPAELLARLDALLRRAKKGIHSTVRTYRFGDVTVNFENGDVTKAGVAVSLAGKELQLLRYLVEQRGCCTPGRAAAKSLGVSERGLVADHRCPHRVAATETRRRAAESEIHPHDPGKRVSLLNLARCGMLRVVHALRPKASSTPAGLLLPAPAIASRTATGSKEILQTIAEKLPHPVERLCLTAALKTA